MNSPYQLCPKCSKRIIRADRNERCGPCYAQDRKISIEQKFWTYVDKTSNCWNWNSTVNHSGYGVIREGKMGPQKRAHRIAWELYGNKIPNNLLVLHRCDNRRCVRREHLFLGTHKDNTKDMIIKGRAGWQNGSPYFSRGSSK